ncbi:MAG: 2-phosphosulfolactate phosphatase [Planctomycetaceae bacterium]|nr:2-phosphosulfolactate phosphatase [Planctomycetaceae bacterium]
MQLFVHYLPQFISEADLAGRTVVVVDLLRASTTICHALAAGADCVVPFVEVDATRRAAAGLDRSRTLLGGERGGQRIEGFDLSNSPAEYTPEVAFGKRVLFTTTNGTRALNHARLARRVIVGAAVNRRAVCEAIAGDAEIDILCAGTNGVVGRDDVLAAGAIAHLLQEEFAAKPPRAANEWAERAGREWAELLTAARALGRTPAEQFADELTRTKHGRTLLDLDLGDDLPRCADLDSLSVVPEQDRRSGEIRAL